MALRIPSPKALTKPEAYLAYKAGILSRDELKQNLYNPLNNYEGWLAKWCGLLETYPTNKDGTPQCLTDEEGLLAYLCGVTDRYPASNSRPDDARISAYIRYLVSARYTRPDHPLNREEFYLSIIKTQYIPSGDPSSDIEIDGTTKAPFVDVKMYGDTFQQSYEGKNLFDYASANARVGYILNDNGVEVTDRSGGYTRNYSSVTPNSEYILSGLDTIGGKTRRVYFYDSNKQFLSRTAPITTGSPTLTFTTPANCYFVNIQMFIPEDEDMSAWQLEAGSTATDYEPFVGGQASPSPDYPQQIQTVTGEQVVEVQGKNKLDVNARPYSIILADYEVNGDEIAIAYNPAGGGTYNYSYVMFRLYVGKDIEAGQTYTLSYDSVRRNIGEPSGRILFTTYSSTSESPNNNLAGVNYPDRSLTFTVPNNAIVVGVALYCPKSDGVTQTYSKVMLEKGSSATSFIPYSKQTYPIDLGDIELCNLGDYQDYIWKDGDDWKVHKETAKLTFDASNDEQWIKSGQSTSSVFVAVLANLRAGGFLTTLDNGKLSKMSNFRYSTEKADGVFRYNKDVGSTYMDYLFLEFDTAKMSTIGAFTTWLENNPSTLYAPIKTATDTTITDQTLIAQLEALVNGGSEEGTTYIRVSATDPNLPAKLYVEAPKYD